VLTAPLPANETERLALLHSLDLLDTPAEPVFDDITRLVAQILKVPIVLVSLIDADRQWFKSRVGLEAQETPREIAFCAHTILGSEPLVVPDTSLDQRFADNPLVTAAPQIQFYVGVPICSAHGLALGTLCAIDTQPRSITTEQLEIMRGLATLVEREIHLREAAYLTRQHIAHSSLPTDET